MAEEITYGEFIRRLRLEAALTQDELATRMGKPEFSQSQISRIEANERLPDDRFTERLGELLLDDERRRQYLWELHRRATHQKRGAGSTMAMVATPPPLNPSEVEQFLDEVGRKEGSIDYSAFSDMGENQVSHYKLDQIYVSLRLAGREPTEDSPRPGWRYGSGDIPTDQLLDPAHRLTRHLILLGDAGSGKTTILRRLVSALAQARLNNSKKLAQKQTGLRGEPPIPLFIPLRLFHHFCQGQDQHLISRRSFFEFLPWYGRVQYDLDLNAAFFRSLLEGGGCLLALDGFDEVPDEAARRRVAAVVGELAADPDIGRNIILLSARVAAYGGAAPLGGRFQTLWVQHLNAEERRLQIELWVTALNSETGHRLEAEKILGQITPDSDLDQLAVTPMIVTALCMAYFHKRELPEQRALLYRLCVDIMLYEKLRPDDPGQTLASWVETPERKLKLLARLAFEMHLAKKEEANKEQAARWLKDGFRDLAEEERFPRAKHFLEAVTARGTLLQERKRLFGFGRQHLTFKEFLAGYHLILGMRPGQRKEYWDQLLPDDRWREPIRLAIGASVFENTLTCEDFLAELLDLADEAAGVKPDIHLAGYKLAAEGLYDLGKSGRELIELALKTKIIKGLADCLTNPAITAPDTGRLRQRVAAAQTLGLLGDPRRGVGLTSDGLPDIAWREIRAGPFLMGDHNQRVELPAYRISRYPVTNAQYRAFVNDKGYPKIIGTRR
jgi:hypothetical protein